MRVCETLISFAEELAEKVRITRKVLVGAFSSQDDLDPVFVRQGGKHKFSHKVEVEVMVLAVENSVFEILGQSFLGDGLLDGLYPKPFGRALGNICCLLDCAASITSPQDLRDSS
jgi:hypothetical protein